MKTETTRRATRPAGPRPGSTGAPDTATGAVRRSGSAFPIVGVGASAGGLDAFRRLLGALPVDTGMAFVLVQHLDPHHESILPELLSEATQLEVAEVEHHVRVEPDRVYVIPPAQDIILVDGRLELVPRSSTGAAHMPIDSFMKTLADTCGSQAIGVILSGMGTDGTLGVRAIEAAGGIAFAQEPASARHDAMPRSAIAAGGVDFVLSPEDIARELTRLGRHPYVVGDADEMGARRAAEDDEREGLARVLDALRKTSGMDFSAYKKATLRRRVARRMVVSHIDTLDAYARHVLGDVAESKALYDDCLISVTSFFRDPLVFQALSERVLPVLLKDRPSELPVRVWVPGCATGEEVYSIAMCLLEAVAALSSNPVLQIFATDLSESALAMARDGTYLENIARDVSPERLRRFFVKVAGQYQIIKPVREMCVFARHDLTRDPPYSRLDLISCRNVLIYLESALQETVFAVFHYALRPQGYLVLGAAETVGSSSAPLFSAVDDRHKIYSRKAAPGPPAILSAMRTLGDPRAQARALAPKAGASASEVPREADRMLLARFGPAGVVVDEGLRIVEFRGDTDPFLVQGRGKASLNLERLVRRGLLMDLRQAIEEARRTGAPARREGLPVRYHDQIRSVALEVVPIKGRAAAERCLLILFETAGVPSHADVRALAPPAADADSKDREIARLGHGLARTTDYLDMLVRDHEAAVEALQSNHQDALSGNEELQSVNEELQTAKEEIQSANEELATLNQELMDRNAQLARSNDDIQRSLDGANALIDTIPLPLVILDDELRVEEANLAYYEAFRTRPAQTRDRRLSELDDGHWNGADLLASLNRVHTSGVPLVDLEVEADLPIIGRRTLSLTARRLHPVRGTRRRILLSIVDRTEIKRAERGREVLLELEHEARERAEAADRMKDQFVATVSHELRGPLTVIAGWTNVLQNAGPSPDAAVLAKAIAAIARGVTAQGRLISDLLDHARLTTGTVELKREPINLLTVAESALDGVRAAAAAKDITIELAGDGTSSVVLGDSDRMQQVLWNLVFNAVKFTPRGGHVWVSVGRVGNQVLVKVRDDGRGIPQEFLSTVFERFRQVDGSSNRTHTGLGLGLTLVRELVELHGGTVQAESDGVDRGSTFTVVLPIPAVLLPHDAPSAGPPSIPPADPVPSTDGPPLDLLAGTTVLVVDDEVDARDALVSLLERYGAHVSAARSVAEAMAWLETRIPDVLVSDLGMPGEDGYELIRRVRALPPDAGGRLPALAVSAYATEEHRKRVMSSGFQGHLEKPVAPAELVTELARLVR